MDNLKQLKLLFEELLYSVTQVSNLIEQKQYEEISAIVTRRQKVIQDIANLKHSYNEKLPEEFNVISEQIKETETKNIARMEQLRAELIVELDKTKDKEKFLNAYSGLERTSGELLDYVE